MVDLAQDYACTQSGKVPPPRSVTKKGASSRSDLMTIMCANVYRKSSVILHAREASDAASKNRFTAICPCGVQSASRLLRVAVQLSARLAPAPMVCGACGERPFDGECLPNRLQLCWPPRHGDLRRRWVPRKSSPFGGWTKTPRPFDASASKFLQAGKLKGTLRYYGRPAEESLGGKNYMLEAGLFDDVLPS